MESGDREPGLITVVNKPVIYPNQIQKKLYTPEIIRLRFIPDYGFIPNVDLNRYRACGYGGIAGVVYDQGNLEGLLVCRVCIFNAVIETAVSGYHRPSF
jgi:hypothetical protein